MSRLVPWHFISPEQGAAVSHRFSIEHPEGGTVLTFAQRQDCDDFAGFVFRDGTVMDEVIYFHPSWSSGPNAYLVNGRYPDFWAFFTEVVIPDSRDWMTEEDLPDCQI